MKRRLFERIPTTGGAVLLAVITLFVALPLAQVVVRVGDLEGAGALLLELAILVGITGGAWSALPDRWSTPWKGFFSGNEVEAWIEPADRDDGRRRPGDPDPYEERFPPRRPRDVVPGTDGREPDEADRSADPRRPDGGAAPDADAPDDGATDPGDEDRPGAPPA